MLAYIPAPWILWVMYPLVMTNSSPWYRWSIEIDGLGNLKMCVDLSSSQTVSHNQRVTWASLIYNLIWHDITELGTSTRFICDETVSHMILLEPFLPTARNQVMPQCPKGRADTASWFIAGVSFNTGISCYQCLKNIIPLKVYIYTVYICLCIFICIFIHLYLSIFMFMYLLYIYLLSKYL